MPITDMSADSLRNTLTNLARVYLWELLIPNLKGGGDADILQTRCYSLSIPGRSVGGGILIPYKQSAGIKYPGKLAYSHTWQVGFIEGEDAKVFDAIHAWNQLVVNDLTGISVGDDLIKTDLYFNQLSTKGNEYKRIKLVGCYPQEVSDVALEYGSEDAIRFLVTFSFDKWESVA